MRLLFSLFFLSTVLHAQVTPAPDCKLISEKDPFTKETKLSTGFIYIDGGSVSVDADKKEVLLLFSLDGAEKCFDDSGTAEVYFEGSKSKTTVKNYGTMNCEGLFQFVYKNAASTPSMLQRICTKKITHIIFTGNGKKPVTVNLGPAEQESLMKLASCLVTEAKKLIQ